MPGTFVIQVEEQAEEIPVTGTDFGTNVTIETNVTVMMGLMRMKDGPKSRSEFDFRCVYPDLKQRGGLGYLHPEYSCTESEFYETNTTFSIKTTMSALQEFWTKKLAS
jgi:hypothetical protein